MGRQHAPPEPLAVLVVEDEFMIAMELVELLGNAGYKVVGPAATVAAALEFLDRHRIRACVLDVNLRGEHSTPVASALKARNVPFVLSSAYDHLTLDQHPEFSDVTNIGKPAPPGRLLSTLASFFKN